MQPMQLFIISGLTALVLGFPMQGLSEDRLYRNCFGGQGDAGHPKSRAALYVALTEPTLARKGPGLLVG